MLNDNAKVTNGNFPAELTAFHKRALQHETGQTEKEAHIEGIIIKSLL